MKRILINANNPAELRVALVEETQLFDLSIETAASNNKRSNIYKGVITRVEPSLEAAFVNFGQERHGFLPFKEIHSGCFQQPSEDLTVDQQIKSGQELIIQVDKEERGTKGASLTTFISIAGAFLVLMPTSESAGNNARGVSRSLDDTQRRETRESLEKLVVPEGMRLILRTSAAGRSIEELQWNLQYMLKLWGLIQSAAAKKKGPFLIYQEDGLIERTIRDHLRSDVEEIIIDDDDTYQRAFNFIREAIPDFAPNLKKYSNPLPLFNHFDIETQIEGAFAREVILPSGGAIVIDATEALISIDVNSGRATQGKGIEETALQTNLEAATEVARQLRLRDLGGLMVIDYIDMSSNGNRHKVEEHFEQALQFDRARIKTSRISRFGLMEMSRQRIGSSLVDKNQMLCPSCGGSGITRSIESSAAGIIRSLEEAATSKGAVRIYLQLPTDLATFIINEKRSDILRIEERQSVSIVIIPNENIHYSHFDLEIIELGDKRLGKYSASFENKTKSKDSTKDLLNRMARPPTHKEKPAIAHVSPDTQAPKKKISLIQRLLDLVMPKKAPPKKANNYRNNRNNNRRNNNNRNGENRNNSNRRYHNRPRRPKQPEKEKAS